MWDPFSRELTPEMLETSVQLRHAHFKQNFARNLQRRKLLVAVLGVFNFLLLLACAALRLDIWVFFAGLALAAVIGAYPFIVTKQLERTVILEAACQQLAWSYLAGDPHGSARTLGSHFPLTLGAPGAHSHRLSAQTWGKANKVPFWNGTYQYTTGSGKNQTTHVSYLYAVQLERAVEHPFAVSPPIHLKGRRIRSESVDFNREFTIHFEGDRAAGGHAFFKAIPPSAMEYLLQLDASLGNFSLELRGTTALIELSMPRFWKPAHTNFLKSPEVHTEDIASYAAHVSEVPKQLSTLATILD